MQNTTKYSVIQVTKEVGRFHGIETLSMDENE